MSTARRVGSTWWARNTAAPCQAAIAVAASVPSNRWSTGTSRVSPTKSLFDSAIRTGQPVATSSSVRLRISRPCQVFLPKSWVGSMRMRILIDPTHDFGKNTWHGLEILNRTDELVATGWPVLMALSNKDFVGETLDVPVDQRLEGTLAATAIAAWQGAAVFRAHQVLPTRRAVDMAAAIRGTRAPLVARRGPA